LSFSVLKEHRLGGPTALLQCNMAYMRCSKPGVKGEMLRRTNFNFDGESTII
jgi:hypothetical protein